MSNWIKEKSFQTNEKNHQKLEGYNAYNIVKIENKLNINYHNNKNISNLNLTYKRNTMKM